MSAIIRFPEILVFLVSMTESSKRLRKNLASVPYVFLFLINSLTSLPCVLVTFLQERCRKDWRISYVGCTPFYASLILKRTEKRDQFRENGSERISSKYVTLENPLFRKKRCFPSDLQQPRLLELHRNARHWKFFFFLLLASSFFCEAQETLLVLLLTFLLRGT